MNRKAALLLGLALAVTLLAGRARADRVLDWNANANAAAVAGCIVPGQDPLHESRLYALVHIAVHDALNAISRRSRPYAYDVPAAPDSSPDAAVAAAAHDVLVSQLPLAGVSPECAQAGTARVEADYLRALASIPEGPSKQRGLAVGKGAAGAIIARRAHDGSDAPLADPHFPQGTEPGQWRFTPDSPPIAFEPRWGEVKPFALGSAAQFRPSPPPAISCENRQHASECRRYAADVEEVRRLGSDGISAPSARSAEQTQIALFWLESSPSAWNRIARSVATARRLGSWESARLLALLNVAQADGYVASWSTKYAYRFWRPVTAIREAAHDGNPGTIGVPGWKPLSPTPPVPEYESAHAVQGAAAAEVLTRVLRGGDEGFSACSQSLPDGARCDDRAPVYRRFRSFWQAALETAIRGCMSASTSAIRWSEGSSTGGESAPGPSIATSRSSTRLSIELTTERGTGSSLRAGAP